MAKEYSKSPSYYAFGPNLALGKQLAVDTAVRNVAVMFEDRKSKEDSEEFDG